VRLLTPHGTVAPVRRVPHFPTMCGARPPRAGGPTTLNVRMRNVG
jgi:hypothetical protein